MLRKTSVSLIAAGVALFTSFGVLADPYRADTITVLQDKTFGKVKGVLYIPSTPANVIWGRLPTRGTPVVGTIPSGGIVTIDTVSHEGILEDQGKDPVKYFAQYGVKPDDVLKEAVEISRSSLKHDFDKDGPHIVTGPIAVQGAKPGDVLKVEVLALEPRVPYGVISNRHYKGALVGEFPEVTKRHADADSAHPDRYGNVSIFAPIKKIGDQWYGYLKQGDNEIRFPLSPFVGVMGVTPNTDESWSSVPPAHIGGNIDINELGVGATLYLPVEVEGAKFYAGDPHFAQGDGEVALTALEGSLRATFRLTVLKKGSAEIPKSNSSDFVKPFAETEKFWIPIGLNEDLDEAMKDAVRESIGFLSKQLSIDRKIVYAYLSAAVDYEVSQVVDKTKGIHALVPKLDFTDYLNLELKAGKESLPVIAKSTGFYVEVGRVSKALGLKMKRDRETVQVTVGGKQVSMAVNSNIYKVGANSVPLTVSPAKSGKEILIPVSVLREVMGLSLNWATEGKKLVGTVQVL